MIGTKLDRLPGRQLWRKAGGTAGPGVSVWRTRQLGGRGRADHEGY
jgi:hypothetical protein